MNATTTMKMCKLTFTLVVIVVASPAESSDTIVLQPDAIDGKDISIYQRTNIPLSSGAPDLFVMETGDPNPMGGGIDDFQSLIEFDLSSISTANHFVQRATLSLFENNLTNFSFEHVSQAFPNTIAVRPLSAAWDEATITYLTIPPPVQGYLATQTVDDVNQWFDWDVTEIVADWLDTSLDNFGLLISSEVEVRNAGLVVGATFDASEQTNGPRLEIMLRSPGDFDDDNDVDGLDFLEWQRGHGSGGPFPDVGLNPDGNNDGVVDALDLNIWENNYGLGAVTHKSSVIVPEPGGELMTLIGTIMLFWVGMNQRRQKAISFCRAIRPLSCIFGTALLMGASPLLQQAVALTTPFTEHFATSASNWEDSTFASLTHSSTGGPDGAGDGFVSTVKEFAAGSNLGFAQTVFRGHDDANASGDAFVGDWIASGVTTYSFWIRHNAPDPMAFGTRFAFPVNSPGANGTGTPAPVSAGVWTKVTIPISSPPIFPEGPPSLFNTVFGHIGNLQISAQPSSANNLEIPITFDLDKISIVPEPSGIVLATCGLVFVSALRRRRTSCKQGMAALLTIAVLGTSAAADQPIVRTEFTPLPEPLASFGAATLDGWIYVYGGHVGKRHEHSQENVRGTFRRQRLEGGPWEDLPSGPALQSPALVAHKKKLYRIGGLSARNSIKETPDLHSVASVECYDPINREWSAMPSLPQPRSSHDAVVVDDQIYVVGGWYHHGEEGEGDWHNSLLKLDLKVEEPSWQMVSKTPFRRRALALAELNGRLYAIGGLTEDIDFSSRVDVFDLLSAEWKVGPELPESDMNGFGASAFNIAGRLFTSSQSNELLALSVRGDQWEVAKQLNLPRFFHRLIPGPNNAVLLIGGANEEDGHLASISLIKP